MALLPLLHPEGRSQSHTSRPEHVVRVDARRRRKETLAKRQSHALLETGSRSELCSSIKQNRSPPDQVLFGKPGRRLVAAKSPNNGAVPPPPVSMQRQLGA